MKTEKQFKKRFAKNYKEVHVLLTPLVELAQQDEIMAWAVFAQASNMLTMIAYQLMRHDEEATVQLVSEAVNKSIEIRRDSK